MFVKILDGRKTKFMNFINNDPVNKNRKYSMHSVGSTHLFEAKQTLKRHSYRRNKISDVVKDETNIK